MQTDWINPSGAVDGVVVLGMHRSGTSAITGLFGRSGFFVGEPDQEIPPDPTNPAGYWELRDTVTLNDDILEQLGGNWFDPPAESRIRERGEQFVARVRGRVDELLSGAGSRPLAIKDPRIQLMLPIWGPAIGGRLHPVIAVRNPLEIGESLQHRNDMPPPVGLAAWELATTRLLGELAGGLVSIAPYQRILDVPEIGVRLVEEVRERLSADRARQVSITAPGGWLRPDLRRNRAAAGEEVRRLTDHQLRIWRWLSALAPGLQRLDPPAEVCVASPHAATLTARETGSRRPAAVDATTSAS